MNRWHIIGHASELAEEGDFVCLPFPDRELAVTRQRGELFAFNNRCPHRGARIFTELRGRRASVCAYHGRFVHAASAEQLPMVVVNGWVLVADGPGPRAPLNTFDQGLLAFLASAPRALAPVNLMTIDMQCHWTVAVENALDHEHVEHVHQQSLGALGLVPGPIVVGDDGSTAQRFTSKRARALDRICALFERHCHFDYVHVHFYPFSCLSSTRGLTYSLQNYLPRADGTTLFVHRLYAAPARVSVDSYIEGVRAVNERTFREDAAICALVPPGHQGPLLGDKEARIAYFRAANTRNTTR